MDFISRSLVMAAALRRSPVSPSRLGCRPLDRGHNQLESQRLQQRFRVLRNQQSIV